MGIGVGIIVLGGVLGIVGAGWTWVWGLAVYVNAFELLLVYLFSILFFYYAFSKSFYFTNPWIYYF